MIVNFKQNSENSRDYNSELLYKILKTTSIESKDVDDKELFVDENWKICSKNMNNSAINYQFQFLVNSF